VSCAKSGLFTFYVLWKKVRNLETVGDKKKKNYSPDSHFTFTETSDCLDLFSKQRAVLKLDRNGDAVGTRKKRRFLFSTTALNLKMMNHISLSSQLSKCSSSSIENNSGNNDDLIQLLEDVAVVYFKVPSSYLTGEIF
jgi:hypothetical protein